MQPLKLKKNQYLWKKDDHPKYIVFLTKGILNVSVNNPFQKLIKEDNSPSLMKKSFNKLKNMFKMFQINKNNQINPIALNAKN